MIKTKQGYKRLISMLLACLMVFAIIPQLTAQEVEMANNNYDVYVYTTSANDLPGERVTVNVRLGANTRGLIAMDLLISYDNTYLTMATAQYFTGSPIAFGDVAPNVNQRPMHLGFSQPPAWPIVNANAMGTGTLAVLQFDICENAPMGSIHDIVVAVTNADGGDAGVTMPVSRLGNTGTSAGRIVVGDVPDYDVFVYTTSASDLPGERVTINVRLGENTRGLIAMDLLISYDNEFLTLATAQYFTGSPIAFGDVAPNVNQRPMHLGFSQPPAWPIVNANAMGTGTLAVLQFDICENAPMGSIHDIVVAVTNADGGNAGVTMPVSRLANTGTGTGTITVEGEPYTPATARVSVSSRPVPIFGPDRPSGTSPSNLVVGDSVRFDLVVRAPASNTAPMENVTLYMLDFPAFLTYGPGSVFPPLTPVPAPAVNGEVVFNIGALNPGQQRIISFTTTVNAPGTQGVLNLHYALDFDIGAPID